MAHPIHKSKGMKSFDDMVEAEKPSCNGKNRGQCEPGTLAQNDTAADPKTFKPATEWTDSKENF